MKRGRESAPQPDTENSDVANLWREFGFIGKPPKLGSPAEQRLREACNKYTIRILDPRRIKSTGAEDHQRQLHNEIAIMTRGISRSDIASADAEKIAEFACQLTTGMSIASALERFEDHGKH